VDRNVVFLHRYALHAISQLPAETPDRPLRAVGSNGCRHRYDKGSRREVFAALHGSRFAVAWIFPTRQPVGRNFWSRRRERGIFAVAIDYLAADHRQDR